MTLSYLPGLLGLLCLPVILALHLFRQRTRKRSISSLSLWSFLEPEVRGNLLSRIPWSWLLLIDLLIGTLLSLALAQPSIKIQQPTRQARQVVELIDTSTSMLAKDTLPDRLHAAELEAADLLNGLNPNDVAVVATFGQHTTLIGDTRQEKLVDLLSQVANLKAGGLGHSLDTALALAQGLLNPKLPTEIHLFTDGDFTPPMMSTLPYPVTWHLVGQKSANQAVLAINASHVSDTLLVFDRLANFSTADARRMASLIVDGNVTDSIEMTIPAESTVPQAWSLPWPKGKPNPTEITVRLIGNDALAEDDSATTGFSEKQSVRVVLVSDQSPDATDYFKNALAALPSVEFHTVTVKEYSPQPYTDLTIFEGVAPPTVWPNGEVLWTASSAATGSVAIPANSPCQAAQDPLLNGIDFSGVRWNDAFPPPSFASGFSPLLSAGTTPLILQGEIGHSQLLLLLPDLLKSNLTQHPAFLVFMGNLVESLRKAAIPPFIKIGDPLLLPSNNLIRSLKITVPGESPSEFRTTWPASWDQTTTPGAYQVDLEDQQGNRSTVFVGVNAGDVAESNLSPQADASQLAQQQSKNTGNQAKPQALNPVNSELHEVVLTPWLLGAGLLMLFLEGILAWR